MNVLCFQVYDVAKYMVLTKCSSSMIYANNVGLWAAIRVDVADTGKELYFALYVSERVQEDMYVLQLQLMHTYIADA